jgi:hypothetical protein
MPFPVKFTAQRGKVEMAQIAVAAGSAEAQSDTISVNLDITHMAKGDAEILLSNILEKIQMGKWPPI